MMLQVIDTLWMEHLDQMEHLRNTVNLRAYGQRDPLVEYKKEGLRTFRNLEMTLKAELSTFLENIDGFFASQQARAQSQNDFVQVIPEAPGKDSVVAAAEEKVKAGRNDPCPCGSGKKVKKCDCEEYKYLRN